MVLPQTDISWHAVLIAIIENAVVEDVNLRRRVVSDSLKDMTSFAESYVKSIINSVLLSACLLFRYLFASNR